MKKQIRYMQAKNDGLNLERAYVNNFLREMQKNLGKYDSNRLMKMLLFEVEQGVMWNYDTALKLFNEVEEANR